MSTWTVAHQTPLSMEFPRQEYWSGLPCPPPGDFPNPGMEPASLALAGRFFTTEPSRNLTYHEYKKTAKIHILHADPKCVPNNRTKYVKQSCKSCWNRQIHN